MRGFYIRAPFATIAVFDAALERIAQILADLGDTETRDRRRVKALLILCRPDLAAQLTADYLAWRDRPADPPELPASDTNEDDLEPEVDDEPVNGDKPDIDWTALLPKVAVSVHVYGGPDSEGIARVDGYGPVTETWVRDRLGAHARLSIRPVLDIPGLAPVDAYEIPDRQDRPSRS
jgi:hypothetical protein